MSHTALPPALARFRCVARVLLALAVFTCAGPAAGQGRIAGDVREVVVTRGDTLRSIASRHGVDPGVIAADNALAVGAVLKVGQRLQVDARHIVPVGVAPAVIVVNVPQRMLFFETPAGLRAWPVAVGRRSWPTPLGPFLVVTREEHPTWDVPESIMEEARRAGVILPRSVPPGPSNPLGDYWLGLNTGGIGIHGTNAPSSIYQAVTHGCIRMHPDDIAQLFGEVRVNARGLLLYEPVLVTRTDDGEVWLEVHADVYRRPTGSVEEEVRARMTALGVIEKVDWHRAAAVIRERAGIARPVGRAPS